MFWKKGTLLALGLAFAFVAEAQANTRLHVKARDFADSVNQELQRFQLRLHNHRTQQSRIQLMGLTLPFNIDVVRVDIDCGILCPDLGDGLFYVNDVTLKGQRFYFNGGRFHWLIEFEDKGREIKGYHNKFGDGWMPDFNLSRNRISTHASPKVLNGQLGMNFSPVRLDADITSTGGCSVAGIDFCNKLFKTDRRIQKGIEKAANGVLASSRAQGALSLGLTRILQREGITGPFTRAYLSGSDLILEK